VKEIFAKKLIDHMLEKLTHVPDLDVEALKRNPAKEFMKYCTQEDIEIILREMSICSICGKPQCGKHKI